MAASFPSWRSYTQFARAVIHHHRHVRPAEVDAFLDMLLATMQDRDQVLTKHTTFWRAQQGHGWERTYDGEEEADAFPGPHDQDRMKPLPGKAIEGRANPKGIPYLYVSTDRETAMSEVRPWLESFVSVAQFATTRELKIANLWSEDPKPRLHIREPDAPQRNQAVWSAVDRAFARPVAIGDDTADYAPTQVVAEFFKCESYDGIAYRSSLGKGYNIVFFDLDAATLLNCFLYKVSDLQFKFDEVANPYFVGR